MEVLLKIRGKLMEGIFKKRLTRFSALVKIEKKACEVFLPNPGRLEELLNAGSKVVLKRMVNNRRKTNYDLIGVYHRGQKVSVDSRIPNKLVLEALKKHALKEFLGYSLVKPEAYYGHTRFDFFLGNESKSCFLEVKSCTLVENGVAMFPDAKTERGARHLLDLIKAKKEGYRACILFIIQRIDAYSFSPNDKVDPKFGKVLREAANQNVEVYAYLSEFVGNQIKLRSKVEVVL